MSEFRPNSRGKGRTRKDCRECECARAAQVPKEKQAAAHRKYQAKNPGGHVRYLARNPSKRKAELERAREYKKENAAKVLATNARRKAMKMNATPAWADLEKIEALYEAARLCTKLTGTQWHVDHIVPLKHPLVQGLHVEANLQVISAFDNLSKKNYWWPDMPDKVTNGY